MLGAWMDGQLGAGTSARKENEADSAASSYANPSSDEPQSLLRSLPGVTMLVNECGDPVSERLLPRAQERPTRRISSPLSGKLLRQGLLTVPRAAAASHRLGASRLTATAECGATVGPPIFDPAPSVQHYFIGSPATEETASSPSRIGSSSATASVESPGRCAVGGSPEQAPTRRALWQILDAAALECTVLDWSMPSSSSWVPSSNPGVQNRVLQSHSPQPCRAEHGTARPFFEIDSSSIGQSKDTDATRGPQHTPQKSFNTPCTGNGGSASAENRSPNPNQGAQSCAGRRSLIVIGDSTSLLYASPVVARAGSPDKPSPEEHYSDVFHLSDTEQLEYTKSARKASPGSSLPIQPDCGVDRSKPVPTAEGMRLDAFRSALRAAGGLDSCLRQDLLNLVDDFDRPPPPDIQPERSRSGSQRFDTPQGIAGHEKGVASFSLARAGGMRSGSPKISITCLSPPGTPQSCDVKSATPRRSSTPRSTERWGSTPSTLRRKWRGGVRRNASPNLTPSAIYDDVSTSSPTQSDVEAALDTMATPPRAVAGPREILPLANHVPGDSPPLWVSASTSPTPEISPLPAHLRRSACPHFSTPPTPVHLECRTPPTPVHLQLGDTSRVEEQFSPIPGHTGHCAAPEAVTPLPIQLRRSTSIPIPAEIQLAPAHPEELSVSWVDASSGPASNTTPLPLHARRSACVIAALPDSSQSDMSADLTPMPATPPLRNANGPTKGPMPMPSDAATQRVVRRGSGALAAARDDFKVSVSASKRSQSFNDSLLSELNTLSASPLRSRRQWQQTG